jgi:hypothetical protein
MKPNGTVDLEKLGWVDILLLLKSRGLDTHLVPRAIARLGKPLDADRMATAKDVVAGYLSDSEALVRHEAMWFLGSWGRFREFAPQFESILAHDPDGDNRCYAAICLGRLFEGTKDSRITELLADWVRRGDQPEQVRLTCYAGLLLVQRGAEGRSTSDAFYLGDNALGDVDWTWVQTLGQ